MHVLSTPAGRVFVTDHALERYRERVRPHLEDAEAVWADMRRLARTCGELRATPPEWYREAWETAEKPCRWLLCGDIAIVCQREAERDRLVAVTTIVRGGISDAARAARNRRKAGKRHRRAHARKGDRGARERSERRKRRDRKAPDV